VEVLTNAERFSGAYNDSLRQYRSRYRVGGHQRPIPDLATDGDRIEIPVWAYRKGEARRRVHVSHGAGTVRLDAEGELITEFGSNIIGDCARWPIQPGIEAGWMLRPRALMLTLWARLFLGDLFIHGIGGAKYDRITDLLIAGYFGIEPPEMACVSASLWLDLPRKNVTVEQIRDQRRILRDLAWNPQRFAREETEIIELARQRDEAIARSRRLRGGSGSRRSERTNVFDEIRRLNSAMQETLSAEVENKAAWLGRAVRQFRRDEIARGREFFFGLFASKDLQRLVDALPGERSFRV
jgi:hypothetical protein